MFDYILSAGSTIKLDDCILSNTKLQVYTKLHYFEQVVKQSCFLHVDAQNHRFRATDYISGAIFFKMAAKMVENLKSPNCFQGSK